MTALNMDDLIGNEDAFPVLCHWDFFNHAGVAPVPRAGADALRRFAGEAERGAYLDTTWYADVENLRRSAATLLNATPEEIALVKNTSEGIAVVARGVDWHAGDKIVTTAVEYPANVYPWMDLARLGVELVMVPEETDDAGARHVPLRKILEAAARPGVRMVALSHVEFASGQRFDLAAVGGFCRDRGILFTVDAIQTLGVFPIDVRAMNVDYLSADGHKWLLGPEGAGVFFCRRELIERTHPPLVGWMNVVNFLEYGSYDYTLQPTAARFECGSHGLANFMALRASMELLMSVGADAIATRLKLLGDRLAAGLTGRGYRVVSPRSGEQWGGAVAFTSPQFDHAEIQRTLRKEHRTELAVREGRLRASPHFYNTEEQIDRLLEHLPKH